MIAGDAGRSYVEGPLRLFRGYQATVDWPGCNKRVVPSDRLLVYEVKEGWGPLCAFLGVPVPDATAFPHLSDTNKFRSRFRWAALVDRCLTPRLPAAPGPWLLAVARVHRFF